MGKKQKTQEEFIDEVKAVHGDTYILDDVHYVNYKTKVTPICREHGKFEISPGHFLCGQGCPKCRYVKSSAALRRSIPEVIADARAVHGDKYDYSMITEYKNDRIKYPIICPDHGVFYQTMNNHIKGKQGCPVCGVIQCSDSRRLTVEEVIRRATEKHNGKYSYELVTELPDGNETKIPIICQDHGVFYQQVNNHLNGQGCPECGKIKIGEKKRNNTEEFVAKFYAKWGHKYDLSKVEYVDNVTKVCAICEKHGEFWIAPHNLLYGFGCAKCGRELMGEKQCSEEEKSLYEFLKELVGEKNIIPHDREIMQGYEIDYVIPEFNIGIEYDGLYWHSEEFKPNNYHSKKSSIACKHGIRMIHIFSDEWVTKTEIVKSMLRNLFGKTENRIYARNTKVVLLDGPTAFQFMDENHIQGRCTSSINLGLEYNGEIVSLMSFGKTRHFIGSGQHEHELMRFCSKLNTEVVGGASKLFKYFIKEYNPKSIVSYADLRWSEGKLYEILGFELYNISKPNYFYIKRDKRFNRFNFRKSILVEKYGCSEDMSEHEFMKEQGYLRIYDCGSKCFQWPKTTKNNGSTEMSE